MFNDNAGAGCPPVMSGPKKPGRSFENGACGTDLIVSELYWDGEKIRAKLSKDKAHGPDGWKSFNVSIGLSGSKNMSCKEGDLRCLGIPKAPAFKYSPKLKIIKMKNYDMDMVVSYLRTVPGVKSHISGFLLRNWPRDDGESRFISCELQRRDISGLSDDQLAEIDFSSRDGWKNSYCEMRGWDFDVKGGMCW